MDSITKWKDHSNKSNFTQGFDAITREYSNDNERRTIKIEEYLIQEAIEAGVIKAIPIKMQKNPNRWAKHLAPWFGEECKAAK